MSIQISVQSLPRVLVTSYLRAARLPLTAIERVTHQQDNDRWAPTLAYESFGAGVEAVVGSVLRDSQLVERGRLRQAKVAQLRKAEALTTVPEQEQAQAEQDLADRREQIADQREETERRAEQRKQDIERQADAQEADVKTKAAQKIAAARKAKAAQDKSIARRERTTKTEALTAESKALRVAKQAVAAQETVELIDERIEDSKAARKTS